MKDLFYYCLRNEEAPGTRPEAKPQQQMLTNKKNPSRPHSRVLSLAETLLSVDQRINLNHGLHNKDFLVQSSRLESNLAIQHAKAR